MKSLLIFLYEYFFSEKTRTLCTLILPSFLVAFILVRFKCLPKEAIEAFYSNILTVLGVLIGFSISFHAIILSGDSEEFRKAKSYYGEGPQGRTLLSLFEIEVANNIYVIVIQSVLILVNIIAPFIWRGYQRMPCLLAFNVAGVVYVIELLLRSILDSYLIITTKKK